MSYGNHTTTADSLTTVTYLPISSGKGNEWWACPACGQVIRGSLNVVLRLIKEHMCEPCVAQEKIYEPWPYTVSMDPNAHLSNPGIVRVGQNCS